MLAVEPLAHGAVAIPGAADIREFLHQFGHRLPEGGLDVLERGLRIFDRIVQHAVMESYSGRLMKGQFPVAVVFIDVAPDMVDVNVHPAKAEVRFKDGGRVEALVEEAVRLALAALGICSGSHMGPRFQSQIPIPGGPT